MKNMITEPRALNESLVSLLLRIILGGLMAYHGYMKLGMYPGIVQMFGDPIGIGQELSAHLVIFAEFVCGIFLVVGFLTRFAVIPVFITMVVAYTVAHAADPFDKKLVPFIYMMLCIPVFISGSGRYSLDALLFRRRADRM